MATVRRKLKNTVKNYTTAQVLVREATSNDPWGPSSTQMKEIADLSYNPIKLAEIMHVILKRINDKNKNWRHVFKSLTLIDYLVKNGHPTICTRIEMYLVNIQTLQDFQYFEDAKDVGMGVREKAKLLVKLITDKELLSEEREKARLTRERLHNINAGGNASASKYPSSLLQAISADHARNPTNLLNNLTPEVDLYADSSSRGMEKDRFPADNRFEMGKEVHESDTPLPSNEVEEEIQLQIALAESKEAHEKEEKERMMEDAKLAYKLKVAVDLSRNEQQSEQPENNDEIFAMQHHQPVHRTVPPSNMVNISQAASASTDPWSSPPNYHHQQQQQQPHQLQQQLTINALGNHNRKQQLDSSTNLFPQPSHSNNNNHHNNNNINDNDNNNDHQKEFNQTPKKDEVALAFLGDNSKLVDLDSLIPVQSGASYNLTSHKQERFNKESTNPFEVADQLHQQQQLQQLHYHHHDHHDQEIASGSGGVAGGALFANPNSTTAIGASSSTAGAARFGGSNQNALHSTGASPNNNSSLLTGYNPFE